VRYIPSVERIGYDRGIEGEAQRSLEPERELVIRRLNRKFGSISDQVTNSINSHHPRPPWNSRLKPQVLDDQTTQ
jgi:hypothetical protein